MNLLTLASAEADLHPVLFHRTLADMNGDGKMDKLEFSVAMHLIKKKLQGYELPKVLPASLKVAPSPVIGSFGMQAGPMAVGQPVVMGIAPAMNPPMGKLEMGVVNCFWPPLVPNSVNSRTCHDGSLFSDKQQPVSLGLFFRNQLFTEPCTFF